MNDSKIPVRYAKALFTLAREKNIDEEIFKDIIHIKEVLDISVEFRNLLSDPVLKSSSKEKVFFGVFPKLNSTSKSFIALLFKNKRETLITDICRDYIDLHLEKEGILKATFTTAVKTDEHILSRIREILVKSYGGKVELDEVHDKSLLGGFILRMNNQQVDASVSASLRKLKKQLLN